MFNSDSNKNKEEIIHTIESSDSRSAKNKAIAIVCALAITCCVIFGYLYLRWRNERQAAISQPVKVESKPLPSPLAEIFVDEAISKGSQAIISGTVKNISQQNLKSVTVEIELTKRKDGSKETKLLQIEPSELTPGQDGHYSAMFQSKDYRSAKVLRLISDGNPETPFKQSPGAKRPVEKPSPQKVKIVIIKPKGSDGDFINSPDTPVVIK